MDKSDINRLNKSILSLQYYSKMLPYISVSVGAVVGLFAILPLHAESILQRLGTIFISMAVGYFLSRVVTKVLDAIVVILQSQVEMLYRLPAKNEEPESPVEAVTATVVATPVVEETVVKQEVVVEAPKEPIKNNKKVTAKRKAKA